MWCKLLISLCPCPAEISHVDAVLITTFTAILARDWKFNKQNLRECQQENLVAPFSITGFKLFLDLAQHAKIRGARQMKSYCHQQSAIVIVIVLYFRKTSSFPYDLEQRHEVCSKKRMFLDFEFVRNGRPFLDALYNQLQFFYISDI